ncbi:hypothetical protein CONLIGDRAFT_343303 [Coniochaeta ligniaria NRRL 30616]|uniref:C2H2-type domain-containing protein n=1 Tax=Coniochaeta ligniaria NRRL 30616 TaxID=1408157 RepID=A0A1J7IQW8_9PEZI|nr:hypothetical protein CONLIGDRAFT_343303 [Coniochaeta ligniaria NRRL 30616]
MASECVARLEKASNEVVRRILTSLCESDAEIEKKVIACLDAFVSELGEYGSHLDGSERQQESEAGTKRKADESLPEVYICRQCGKGFLEEHNNDGACFHHPGYLAVDYESEVWDDWDEPGHGIIDSEESRKNWPDGFKWDCCGETGEGKAGCQYSRHEAMAAKRQKTMDMPKPPVTIDLTED